MTHLTWVSDGGWELALMDPDIDQDGAEKGRKVRRALSGVAPLQSRCLHKRAGAFGVTDLVQFETHRRIFGDLHNKSDYSASASTALGGVVSNPAVTA